MIRASRPGLISLLLALAFAFGGTARAESFYVEGHGGVPLAVTVAGPEDAPAILFLHGIGMGVDAFSEQFDSDLAESYRLVAFDLRGHGMSGKPWEEEAYTDRAAWAGDVERVIAATGIEKPVVVAWSYGTLVAADYLTLNGLDGISGLVLVSALGGMVPQVLDPGNPPSPELIAQLTQSRELRKSPALRDQQRSAEILAPMLYEKGPEGPSPEWERSARMLGVMVPSYAQGPLRSHPNDNAALAEKLAALPVLVIGGDRDFGMSRATLDLFREAVPHARICVMENAGHSSFAEQPARFNRALAEFVEQHGSAKHDH